MCSRVRNTEQLDEDMVSNEEEVKLTTHDRPKLDAEVPNHLTPIVRHYIMQWDNSLSNLANNPSQANWSPVQGFHMELFGSKTRYAPNATKAAEKRGNLEQAILIGMKIKKVESNFPCQLGLKISGCKGNFYTCNGERYAYLVGQSEKSNNMEQKVATTNPYVNSEYLRLYPGMTKDNLRTKGIMHVPGENYVFVDKEHPIVEMMSENSDVLQIDIDAAPLIDTRWYKVSKTVTERCIKELESELMENLPLLDLSSFNASIERLYGTNWDEEAEVCDGVSNDEVKSRIMSTPRRCTVVLELTYSFV